MNTRTGHLILALLLSIAALAAMTVKAATGPEVAQLLNRNFQFTPSECTAQKPAHACSGVLARGSPSSGQFWQPDPVSSQLGAQSFTYLRADLGTRSLAQPNGVLLSDGFTAISQGKTLDVLCAYPFPFTLQANRSDFGCGWVAASASALSDSSSCAAQGVSDARSWLEHFQQQNLQPVAQCSLSSLQSASFKASLEAHESLDADWSAKPTQLQLRNWEANTPKQMPILGVFYDVTQTGSLLGAQKDQRDYFDATGDWLPIVRMDLSQAPEAVFGFDQQDQLYVGYQVAARLNARYADTSPTCRDNTAAYNCNGVLIRTTDVSTDFHSWDPSPQSVTGNGVSYTYARADALISKVYKPQGFITRESFSPTGKPLTVRCLYTVDGHTGGSQDICRPRGGMCAEIGITTRESWIARYATNPVTNCAFDTDPAPFQLATTLRPDSNDPYGWNELIMAPWTEEEPEKLPLEAFTVNTPSHQGGDGLAGARYIQRDYFQVTGRFVPIVRANFNAAETQVFNYYPQDQTVQDTPMVDLSRAIPFIPLSLRDD
ncbi:hypothetical protein BK653_01265 [Pseudomonas brassicacearum]|uniref:hypothetical protein n=1 Tax=Pseudomonas brassicacearum TaxID=930166 RepID=UPI000F478A5D|nr:hypothetical protein [Pseudomonas brassicacearum]ROM70549.1 hypothetical protein BK653_01265 [Pseudomonas brassicacearum]